MSTNKHHHHLKDALQELQELQDRTFNEETDEDDYSDNEFSKLYKQALWHALAKELFGKRFLEKTETCKRRKGVKKMYNYKTNTRDIQLCSINRPDF